MKSYYPKEKDRDPKWYVVDLKGKTLGRAATAIALVLRGKNKATFTPSMDMGDFVVAINARHVALTGKKWQDKKYYRHSGYLGGLREMSAEKQLAKDPTSLITLAVKGMLPRGTLGANQLKKFKVYADADHPHTAQKPTALTVKC